MRGRGWVVREGVGAGGEMTQASNAHMNNKTNKQKEKRILRKTQLIIKLAVYITISKAGLQVCMF
jgi:hypothetical protein